jgi:hypothetical protein
MYQYPNMQRCWAARVAIILGVILLGTDARADLVAIEYYDRGIINPEFAGGPLWTGHVDTIADTLTIQTWKELPLHGAEFWIPRSLPDVPLVWPARDAAGNAFDVPDTFDGHIDDTFAFISDDRLQDIEWKAPIFNYGTTPPTFVGTVDVEYTLNTGDVWPGWGGYALQRNVNGFIVKVFETANPSTLAGQPLYDERMMPALPVQPPGQPVTYTSSTDATVTVTYLSSSPSTVPEARQWLSVPAAFLAALALRWFTQRRSVAA